MRDFCAEVWGWIVQSASDISASSLPIEAFQGLSKEQQHDLAARYMADLGVDGESIVSAQGTFFLIFPKFHDNSNGGRSKFTEFRGAGNVEASNQGSCGEHLQERCHGSGYQCIEHAKLCIAPRYGYLSVRGIIYLSMIPCVIEAPCRVSAVSSDNQADASLGPVNANAFVTGNRGHGLRKCIIASSCGTYHTTHYDANGVCTLVTVKEGYKLWIWGVRRSRSLLPTPLPKQGRFGSWHWALFDDCIVYAVVLGPGDGM